LILFIAKFSGKITFLINSHQKHSEFLKIQFSIKNSSGFSLLHFIVKTVLFRVKSIFSSFTQAIGAIIIISSSASIISRAT